MALLLYHNILEYPCGYVLLNVLPMAMIYLVTCSVGVWYNVPVTQSNAIRQRPTFQ